MKTQLFALALVAMIVAPSAFAHGEKKHDTPQMTPGRDTTKAELAVTPAAADAVAAVDRFSAALGTGALDKAAVELDPSVLILESGGAERSRDEYLAGHAKNDAAFLKAAHVTLKRRTAHSAGDLAWVASESEIHAVKEKDMLMIASTETMVVRKTEQGWKIVHIHWSSRRADAKH